MVGTSGRSWPPRRRWHPAQAVVGAYGIGLAAGTALLTLPVARRGPGGAGFVEALFTATSALSLTGLAVVDTGTHWSGFGQAVVLALVQVGGLGIMTLTSVLAILLARRLGVRARLNVVAEARSVGVGDVRRVLLGVATVSLLIEAAVAAVLTLRLAAGYDEPLHRALWLGVFHGVQAFNNGGLSLYPDSLVRFVTDPWVLVPIDLAVIAGGLGFPVLFQLRRDLRVPRLWTMNTRLVLAGTAGLLGAGTLVLTAQEWQNDETLGPLGVGGKLLAGFTSTVMTRSGGFNVVDVGAMEPGSWLVSDVLMFIGAGPAGTGGGIKVTTFLVLFFVIYAEARGEGAVNVFGKRLPRSVHRQAIAVALLSVAGVIVPTLVLLPLTHHTLDVALFEVISAFATVGLSTGITPDLPTAAHLILVVLMFIGRLGPITLASALALRQRRQLFDLPKERPVIG
ncbi:TrkH family potassium uptake protein [Modestobacter sp. URMC 112]